MYTIVSHLQGAPKAGVTGIVGRFLGWGTQLDVIVSADNLSLGCCGSRTPIHHAPYDTSQQQCEDQSGAPRAGSAIVHDVQEPLEALAEEPGALVGFLQSRQLPHLGRPDQCQHPERRRAAATCELERALSPRQRHLQLFSDVCASTCDRLMLCQPALAGSYTLPSIGICRDRT